MLYDECCPVAEAKTQLAAIEARERAEKEAAQVRLRADIAEARMQNAEPGSRTTTASRRAARFKFKM